MAEKVDATFGGIDRLRDVAQEYINKAQRLEAKVAALKLVLRQREKELLFLKGPCSNEICRLHLAHSGPCAQFAPDPD
jgi:hypothetical protein